MIGDGLSSVCFHLGFMESWLLCSFLHLVVCGTDFFVCPGCLFRFGFLFLFLVFSFSLKLNAACP